MENRFLDLIEKTVKEHWDTPVFSDYEGDTFLYKDMAKEIEKLHMLFRESGIQKGDKIAIIGRNSARWGIGFFAVLAYGAVIVPLLHDFTAENVQNLVNHSGAKILLVAQHNRNSLDLKQMPGILTYISLEDYAIIEGPDNVKEARKNIEDLFNRKYPEFTPAHVKFYVEDPEELAVINYTSGTTGYSKGVMLPFRSLWSNTQFAYDKLPFIHAGDNMVCMLPMAHTYGLAFEILNGVNKGCHIHFLPRIPSPNIIIQTFNKICPTLIIAVPIIIEKIVFGRVFPVLEKPMMKALYPIPGFKQLIHRKILKQLNSAFGNNFAEIVLGGAALDKKVEAFLKKIGFRYTVGYGMTECGPLIAYEQWDTFKQASVGRIVDRMEAKIDSSDPQNEIGEILVRGANAMLGYYKNPEATKEAYTDDGWMHTGDLGVIDKDGFLFIRGRSKTMLLSSSGQNIYPEEIESELNKLPYVSESLVISREDEVSHKYMLIGLVYPNWEQVKQEGITEEGLQKIMNENLAKLNKLTPFYCKVSEIRLREHPFEKTPKLSIRRFLYQNQ